jgi:hypothetical protein
MAYAYTVVRVAKPCSTAAAYTIVRLAKLCSTAATYIVVPGQIMP